MTTGGTTIQNDGASSARSSGSSAGPSIQTQSDIPEPIAIVGASCRLPGSAHNVQKLWELLRKGGSAWSRTPANRFNQAGFHCRDGETKQGTTNTDGGHFLEQDIAAFDASFFGIHAAEANAMDPQQRLLLEIAYESFENAGFSLDDLSDSNTGVYVGEWSSDYHEILTRDLDYPPTYLISGTGAAISSNRISYVFNLKGPSFTVDTGCSASLVALHQAVQGLRAGETEQCFVGGVNLILDPQHYAYQSKLKMFSNDGKSFPFDNRANGYGRGEGCTGVILQPLSLALKQGRPIQAIIRNSAVNQDGHTSGLTVPSSAAQTAAIRTAYSQVKLDTRVDYVEAHGTGTRTGDPIEAKAIGAILSVDSRNSDDPALPIGSVKGNVGHTESAAGLTGLLKAMLMLQHNVIPPQVNSEHPNPAIPFAKLKLRIPQKLEHRRLTRISINSFGYGGTNAHVILESAATLSDRREKVAITNGNGVSVSEHCYSNGSFDSHNIASNGNGSNGHHASSDTAIANGVNGHDEISNGNGVSTNGTTNGHNINSNGDRLNGHDSSDNGTNPLQASPNGNGANGYGANGAHNGDINGDAKGDGITPARSYASSHCDNSSNGDNVNGSNNANGDHTPFNRDVVATNGNTNGHDTNGNGINGHGLNGNGTSHTNGNGVNSHSLNGNGTPHTNGNGVNSHGLNGNAKPYANGQSDDISPSRLFVVSAASQWSCQTMAASLAEYVRENASKPNILNRLAYTLSRRSIFAHRIGLLSSTAENLASQLIETSTQPIPASSDTIVRRIAFIFSGQGAQYPQMARELLSGKWPIFTASMERAASCIRRCGGSWDLILEISHVKELSRVEAPEIAQPLTTAIQLALVDTLRDLGVVPTLVAGHSSGEIAAAYAAGSLTFEDAMTVSFHRGRLTGGLLSKLAGTPGAMLAVGKSSHSVAEVIEQLGDSSTRVKIACYNSPSSVTVSGDADAIDDLHLKLEGEGIFNRKLRTGGAAYHSRQMEAIAQDYAASIGDIKPSKANPSTTMVSSVLGTEMGDTLLNSDYWVKNLVSPVLFEQAVKKLSETKSGRKRVDIFLELGPHFQLVGPVKQTLRTLKSDASKVACSGTLKRGEDAEFRLLDTLRFLYLQRYPFKMLAANSRGSTATPALLMDLPPYAFDKSRTYWHESRISKAYRNREHLPHEILGTLSPEDNKLEPQWRNYLRLDNVPWLNGHIVQGDVVFPAAGYISLAVEAAQRDALSKSSDKDAVVRDVRLRNISIESALVLTSGKDDLELFVKLRPQTYSARRSSDTWQEFRIFTVSNPGVWTEHCRGLVHVAINSSSSANTFRMNSDSAALGATSLSNERKTSPKKFYHLAKDAGLDWRDPFDNLTNIRTSANSSIVTVSSSSVAELSHSPQGPLYTFHPATLDSCLFQSLYAVLMLENKVDTPVVPTFIKSLRLSVPETGVHLTDMTCHAVRTKTFLTFDVTVLHSGSKDIVVQAEGVTATKLPSLSSVSPAKRELCHTISWTAYTPAVTQQWLQDNCRSQVDKVSIVSQHQTLDALALSYIQPVLKTITREDVPEGHLRYWYDWMQTCVGQEYDSSVLSAALEDESVGARALKRVGPHVEELLRGSMHSLTLLTEGDLLSQVYTDERCRRCYKQIAKYVSELGRERPNMKILEIGGGTASTTGPVLEALRHSSGQTLAARYDFTDISPAFFTAARAKLEAFGDIVNFKVFNAENDPVEQGFELHDYDLVIAANVIHATSSIDRSVKHVQSLLKPGGKFILMEITEDLLYLNLVFGTLSGWWAGYDEGRKLSPLLSDSAWSTLLQSHGFAQTDPFFRDHDIDDGGTQCVFIASSKVETSTLSQSSIDIVTTSLQGNSQQSFVDELHARIKDVQQANITTSDDAQRISVILEPTSNFSENEFKKFQETITGSNAVLFVTTVTDHPDHVLSGEWLTGFCRSLRLEHTDIRFVSLLLEGQLDSSKIDPIITILQSPSMDLAATESDADLEFAERNGQLFVARVWHEQQLSDYVHQSMARLPPVDTAFHNDRTMFLELETPGLMETMRWTDDDKVQSHLGPNDVKIKLLSASVNFKEVLIAAGQLEGITQMVNDCSGVVVQVGENMQHRYVPGDRVLALDVNSFANYPTVHGDCIHVIPDDMDFDTAAAIPVVWITVFYSLVDCGRLQKGDKILIHSAAGAVGQAAVLLARHIGAEIFVTVGNDSKRELLKQRFGIPEDHIFSSRTTDFRDGIFDLTSGQGVDVVLNSLGGELLRESCNVVAPFGRFVEIGRKDLMEDALMPMEFMLKNITLSYVDMKLITDTRKQLVQRLLHDSLELFTSGAVESVMLTKMPISQISDAFRFIQSGRHVGKVVLTVEPDQIIKAVPAPLAQPVLRSDATYIVTGGLGGLGKRIVSWLAERGACNIVTMSRTGTIDEESSALVQEMRSNGVTVQVKKCDISSATLLKQSLSEIASELPPIRGLIQSAMVLKDSLFADMTVDQWSAAMSPKVQGTWNLHKLLPSDLDFFIMFSSAVAIAGNVGQSNYSAACSFQDGLAHHRVRLGLRAHSINVGAISEAGFVSENPEVAIALRRKGLGTVAVADFLSHLDNIVSLQSLPPTPAQTCQTAVGLIPSGDERGLGQGTWLNDKKYVLLGQQVTNRTRTSDDSSDIGGALSAASELNEAIEIACRATIDQLGKIIGLPSESISAAKSLNNYGVDSLVAVELRNWINIHLKANLSLLTVRNTSSIGELVNLIVKESKLVSNKVKGE